MVYRYNVRVDVYRHVHGMNVKMKTYTSLSLARRSCRVLCLQLLLCLGVFWPLQGHVLLRRRSRLQCKAPACSNAYTCQPCNSSEGMSLWPAGSLRQQVQVATFQKSFISQQNRDVLLQALRNQILKLMHTGNMSLLVHTSPLCIQCSQHG